MWRSLGYREYYNFIEDSQGFWRHRWGDSPGILFSIEPILITLFPVHSLAVGIFLESQRVHRFEDILYKHRLIGEMRQSPL